MRAFLGSWGGFESEDMRPAQIGPGTEISYLDGWFTLTLDAIDGGHLSCRIHPDILDRIVEYRDSVDDEQLEEFLRERK